jgi:hypothetical protein
MQISPQATKVPAAVFAMEARRRNDRTSRSFKSVFGENDLIGAR